MINSLWTPQNALAIAFMKEYALKPSGSIKCKYSCLYSCDSGFCIGNHNEA